jgi:hypothetical protein
MARPTKNWNPIEAKKTFAGLTRAWRPLSKSPLIAGMYAFVQAGSLPPDGGRPVYAISRAIAALKAATREYDPL